MTISSSISRLMAYYRREGLAATFRRAAFATQSAVHSNGFVLFYCDLSEETMRIVESRVSVQVERLDHLIEQRRNPAELRPDELDAMTSFWNPELARLRINERFAAGAILWLIKVKGEAAGYGWTLQGKTIEPHFFPLGQRDVHLFDFYVFPQYRGKGLNPLLVSYILRSLAGSGSMRALIEASEHNRSQLSSLEKTRFRTFGCAKRWRIFGHTVIYWCRKERNRLAELDIRQRSATRS